LRKILSIIAVLAMALALMLPTGMVSAAGTTLFVEVTVTPKWTLTYGWTIDKSVTPETWDLFVGDTGTSKYTITVTKDAGTEEAWVEGQICVTNGGAVATQNLAITAVLKDGYEPPNDFLGSAPVDVSGNQVLDPGEEGCYYYRVNISIHGDPFKQPNPTHTYKVTADVTITNHSGHEGTPYGASPSVSTNWPASKTLINNSINVDDTNGGSWPFSNSGSVSYEKTFECTEPGQKIYNNTATIRQTGQSDGARVTVSNYALEVTKTADTSFDRTYDWTIDKYADQNALTLAIGQSFLVNYGVCVDVTGYVDSAWAAVGTITVHNPAPIAADITAVTDGVSPDIAATVEFAVVFPYALAAEGDLAGTYSVGLPDASTRTNTATVAMNNYAYYWDGGEPEWIGTTEFSSDPVDVDFTSADITDVDESITVTDSYAGGPQEVAVCYGVDTLPKCFPYSRSIGPYGTCSDYTVSNTASFVTNDQVLTDSDNWMVNVRVPCAGGCTLTIGYWKNHAGLGNGRQSDMVTARLPILLGSSGGGKTQTVNTVALAVQFLGFKGSNNVFDASNGINKLYAQLLGAKLNIASGANGSAVASTIAAADAFLALKNSSDWGSLSKAQKNQVLSWMSTLDNYNNGLIGPGHCSE